MDDAGVLPAFRGVAVHDGFTPYRTYTKARHALCGTHHLRELIGAQEAGQAWASGMGCLLLDTKDAVEEAKAAGLKALSDAALAELHASYRGLIDSGYEQNPGLAESAGQKIKRPKAQNLLLRLDKREREATLFAHDFTVPFSNNQAENDIRMVKLQQKISGCFRTMEGAERFLAVRSYISTARKQGQDTLGVLSALAQGTPWLPAAGETLAPPVRRDGDHPLQGWASAPAATERHASCPRAPATARRHHTISRRTASRRTGSRPSVSGCCCRRSPTASSTIT